MPESDPYIVYLIHTWEKNDDYLRFFEYLGDSRNFFYTNCSSPDSKPAAGDRESIQKELQNQMRPAEVVAITSSVFMQKDPLVEYQLTMAKAFKKPIFAMEHFGGMETPITIKQHVSEVVGWYDRSMVDAIKKYARGEPTNRWETIDFP